MTRRSARLLARAQSTQLDSQLTSEVNKGGDPYGATDDADDPDHPWCFCQQPSDGKCMVMCNASGCFIGSNNPQNVWRIEWEPWYH